MTTQRRRRYFAIRPSWGDCQARIIDVIGGDEKDHAGMDAAVRAAHEMLGKSVEVKLIPSSGTRPSSVVRLGVRS
jgi:hypothetical protein